MSPISVLPFALEHTLVRLSLPVTLPKQFLSRRPCFLRANPMWNSQDLPCLICQGHLTLRITVFYVKHFCTCLQVLCSSGFPPIPSNCSILLWTLNVSIPEGPLPCSICTHSLWVIPSKLIAFNTIYILMTSKLTFLAQPFSLSSNLISSS